MSVRYSLAFLMLAGTLAVVAIRTWTTLNLLSWLLAWATGSFFLLALAYAGVGPRLLLKRAAGTRSALAWPLFAPYFFLNALCFCLYRWSSRAPAHVELLPNLHFGRRLTAPEAQQMCDRGLVAVLDLAAEFAEVRPFRELQGYLSLPVLDATAPTPEELRRAVAWLREQTGPVYIHCALGHGRSATVALAYLLEVGEVKSIQEGVRRLRALRPGVKLNRDQRQALKGVQRLPRDSSAKDQHQ